MNAATAARAFLWVGAFVAGSADALPCQEAPTTWSAEVLGVAGEDFYLSIGADAGLTAGAELELRGPDDDRILGRVRVDEVSSRRAIVSYAGPPFPVTRGARVSVLLVTPSAAREVPVAAGADRAVPAASRPPGPGLEAHGSVGFAFEAGRTTTEWDAAGIDPTDRSFTTPESWINLRVRGLPAGFQFRMDARASYRGSSDDLVEPAGLVRVSGARLTNSFGPVDLGIGRTYNPYDNSSGYFDGVYARAGRSVGVGFAAGFEPERGNAGVSTEVPKGSVFFDASARSAALVYAGVASATLVRPTDEAGRLDRTFVALRQTLRVGRFRAGQSLQLDRDPGSDWNVSRLVLDAGAVFRGGIGLRGFYSRRRPVDDDPADAFQPFTREQATLGVGLARGGFHLAVDGGVHSTQEDGTRGPMVTGSASYIAESGFGADLSAGYWEDADRSATSVRPGLRFRLGEARARTWYGYYRAADPLVSQQTHTVGASLSAALPQNLRLDVSGRVQLGETLRGTWVSASIGWLF